MIPYVSAMETKIVNINNFDEFSLEQVQNTFSNSLTQEKTSDNKSEQNTENSLFCNGTDYNVPTFLSVNLKQPTTFVFCYNFDTCRLNYLCQYKLFEKINLSCGIGEYKIKQNAYMAVALFDTISFVYI
ncbi:MAG: hypothetical protein IKN42_07485 [Elusimicrobia bacterium]|nr:hypothetical protein [Elusimicrobiota bacterium]